MKNLLVVIIWLSCCQLGFSQSNLLTAGTIGSPQQICYNTAPAALFQLTAPTGGSGSYTYLWQKSTNNSTWGNISGATLSGYTPPILRANTWYRRKVTSGTFGTVYTNTVLITVNANLTPGSIGTKQSICYNTAPAPLTQLTIPTGGTGTYTYQWQSSPNNSAWTNITGATEAGYSPPALKSKMYYRRSVTSETCGTVNSASILISVFSQITPGTIGTAQTICFNTMPAALTQLTSPKGGNGTYTYQWQSSSDNNTWTNITAATAKGYSPPALISNTYYRRSVTSGTCGTVNSASILISVFSQITPGTIGTAQTICYNTSPAGLTQLTIPTGGTGTYTYQWQSSPNNSTWTNITGATAVGYSPPALKSNTYYRRSVTSGTCGTVYSASILITISVQLNPGTIGTAQTICYNTSPAGLIQLTSPTGGTGTYTYQWQSSPDNGTWTDIAGAIGADYSPSALTSNTYYRRSVTSGTCETVLYSTSILITVFPQVTLAQLHDNISIENNTSTNFNIAISGGTSPFTVNYTLNEVAQPAVANYTGGANIATGVLSTGVYKYALTSVTDKNGCAAQSLGTDITVTVTETSNLAAGTIGSAQSVCYSTSPAALTQLTAPSGGTGEYTYQWQNSADNSTWTDIVGATLSDYSPPALLSSTYYRRTVTSGSYIPVHSISVLITVFPEVTLAQLHDNISIGNNTSTNFNIAISGGTSPFTVNYTLKGVAQPPITSYTSGANISTGILTTGVYSYALTSVTDANGCAAQSLGTDITVTVTEFVTENFHYDFTYADRSSLLAAGWNFIAVTPEGVTRNTEQTSGAVVNYDQKTHPGVLRIPVDQGDLWLGATNNTRNTLFRNLPPDWTSVRLKISSFAPLAEYQQAGLFVYQNDNNYVQISREFNGGNKVIFAREIGSYADELNSVSESANANLYFWLDRDPATETITSYYSLNGSDWTFVGNVVQSFTNPRLAIVTGGLISGSLPNADIAWAEVTQVSAPITDELCAFPNTIVYNAVQGHPLNDTKSIYIFTTFDKSISWSQSSDVNWLTPNIQNGATEGILKVGVKTDGLASGLHHGNITIESSQSTAGPIIIPVTLIINPDVPVKITTWKDGMDGSMSVSVDDGQPSGFVALQRNGFKGTYFSNNTTPPSFYTDYYNAGMELASHLVNHPCVFLPDDILRSREIEPNISGICTNTPEPCKDVISLAWPCGVTNYREQAVASQYFLSARGFNINQLEDATPDNFMNLKCYNSHNLPPDPPSDLKTVVDAAVIQHKWFNLVLHELTNDDGAIDYAHTKNIWVTSIGTVIKYIIQRDRFILTNYNESSDRIMYSIYRLPIPSSVSNIFEDAFGPNDLATMQIDIDDNKVIENVLIDGEINNPYQIKVLNGNKFLLTNLSLDPHITKTVEINYKNQFIPLISLDTNSLNFSTMEGENPASQFLSITTNIPGSISWSATIDNPAWLSINPDPAIGTGNGTLEVLVTSAGLPAGYYNKTITITSTEASNSPLTVNITLTVIPKNLSHYDFTYRDRSSLLAAGWDFIAVTPEGGSRNTEQTSGAVVSYDQDTHLGVLRIPVDQGNLWSSGTNNTRNTLFRDLPGNWTSVRLKISSFAPLAEYQQAGLFVYQDDNNYVQISREFNSGNIVIFANEVGSSPHELKLVSESAITDLYFRLDRDPVTETITSYYSLDGSHWILVGNVVQSFTNPRLAIVTGGSPGGLPNADIAWAEVITDNSGTTSLNNSISLKEGIIPSIVLKGEIKQDTVVLNWKSNAERYFEKYLIYRSSSPILDFNEIRPYVETNDTSYIDFSQSDNSKLYYRVRKQFPDKTYSSASNEISLKNVTLEPTDGVFPLENKLHQNYPNPLNTYTWIEYDLAEDSHVTLEVYNSLGEKIETVLSQYMRSGNYKFIWNSHNYVSGTYYLSLKTKTYLGRVKMILFK